MTSLSDITEYTKIGVIIILPLIIGNIIGFLFRPDKWYISLKKPIYTPPSIVFQIVWPILYILIGVSLYYGVYNKNYIYWIIPVLHLISNFLFSPIMFGMKSLLGGFISSLSTLLLTIIMIIQFYFTDNTYISIYVLIPYIIWLIFATILSYNTYKMNI